MCFLQILSGIVEDCLGLEHQTTDTDSTLDVINQYLMEKGKRQPVNWHF